MKYDNTNWKQWNSTKIRLSLLYWNSCQYLAPSQSGAIASKLDFDRGQRKFASNAVFAAFKSCYCHESWLITDKHKSIQDLKSGRSSLLAVYWAMSIGPFLDLQFCRDCPMTVRENVLTLINRSCKMIPCESWEMNIKTRTEPSAKNARNSFSMWWLERLRTRCWMRPSGELLRQSSMPLIRHHEALRSPLTTPAPGEWGYGEHLAINTNITQR